MLNLNRELSSPSIFDSPFLCPIYIKTFFNIISITLNLMIYPLFAYSSYCKLIFFWTKLLSQIYVILSNYYKHLRKKGMVQLSRTATSKQIDTLKLGFNFFSILVMFIFFNIFSSSCLSLSFLLNFVTKNA